MCGGRGHCPRQGSRGKEGALAPASKEQGGKRRVPDIKARAGDREGSGAHEGSPVALRVRQGLRTRGRREIATLEGVEHPGGGLRRPRRAVQPPAMSPGRRWASAAGRRAAGCGSRGWRRGGGPLAPRRGEWPGLSYSAFSWKRPWRHKGWWLRPGPVAPPAVAPRPGSAPRRREPRAGDRIPVRRGVRPHADRCGGARPGLAGRLTESPPPCTLTAPARLAPGLGHWVGTASPSHRPLPRG